MKAEAKVKKDTFLQKCLTAIEKGGGGSILIWNYEKSHLLIMTDPKADTISCTTTRASRLMEYANEEELVPCRGYRCHFYPPFKWNQVAAALK